MAPSHWPRVHCKLLYGHGPVTRDSATRNFAEPRGHGHGRRGGQLNFGSPAADSEPNAMMIAVRSPAPHRRPGRRAVTVAQSRWHWPQSRCCRGVSGCLRPVSARPGGPGSAGPGPVTAPRGRPGGPDAPGPTGSSSSDAGELGARARRRRRLQAPWAFRRARRCGPGPRLRRRAAGGVTHWQAPVTA
jgi:hypothetical protein